MSQQVSYKKQVIFYIMLILVFFAAVEIIFQFADFTVTQCRIHFAEDAGLDKETRDQLCRDRNQVQVDPFTLEITPDQELGTITINNYGFRGDDITKSKPADTYRIFMMGGSTMEGDLTADYQTIPAYLEKKFSEKSLAKNVQVINAGCSSCHSYHETMKIKNKILEFEPDMIVVYDGWNDAMREIPNELKGETTDIQSYGVVPGTDDKIRDFLRMFQDVKTFSAINRIVNYGGDSLRMLDRTIEPYNDAYLDVKTQEWKERWEQTCQLGNEKNFDVIVTIQPLLGSSDREMTLEESLWYKRYDNKNLNLALEKYVEKMYELNSCTKVHDFTNMFDGVEGPLFFDNGHVGPRGNQHAAEEFFDLVYPIVSSRING